MLDIRASVIEHAPNLTKKLPKPLFNLFIKTLKLVFHEKMFFSIYAINKHLHGLAFVRSMLESLNLSYTLNPMQLSNIPSTGRLLVIANHPTGAIDTMIMVDMIAQQRENKKVRIVANKMLMNIHQVASLLIPVDNINGAITKESLKLINTCLENDEAVIFFPEGKVDRLTFKGIKDNDWKPSFIKIAKRTKTPILPLHIKGRNSILFYIVSLILPKRISGLLLIHEFATGSKRKPIHITIGKIIPFSSFSDTKKSINTYMHMFFKHVYNLPSNKAEVFKTQTTIIPPVNRKLLLQEINSSKKLGYSKGGYRVVLAYGGQSPYILEELGRIREISFRAIGVGGDLDRDNDSYDTYYQHLFLWDEEELEIVGAYRIGECTDIIKTRGRESLYLSELCTFNEHFDNHTHESIELGRSFVQPKYWKTRAFDNLWEGITLYLAYRPEIRYSYGVVTINADYPAEAVAVLVYFYSLHFKCATQMMKAKEPYILEDAYKEKFDTMFKGLSYKEGFVILKKYLRDMGQSVPTLFKQYIELYEEGGVRYFDFSVSELLHGLTGGFIVVDNHNMKKSMRDRNLKSFNAEKGISSNSPQNASSYFKELASS